MRSTTDPSSGFAIESAATLRARFEAEGGRASVRRGDEERLRIEATRRRASALALLASMESGVAARIEETDLSIATASAHDAEDAEAAVARALDDVEILQMRRVAFELSVSGTAACGGAVARAASAPRRMLPPRAHLPLPSPSPLSPPARRPTEVGLGRR